PVPAGARRPVRRHQLRARGIQPPAGATAGRRPRAGGAAARGRRPAPAPGGAGGPADHRADGDEHGHPVDPRDPRHRGVRAAGAAGGGVGSRVARQVIVSGARPTGRLHLGNWHGAFKNWVRLQQEHDCFFFVADWHALTTAWEDPQGIDEATIDMVLDWLAVGLDPAQCTMFQQSAVKEHAELFLILGMVTPAPWLERYPTYKGHRPPNTGPDRCTH